jgi:cell division protein FtsB
MPMILLHEIRKRARHIAGPVLAISVFSYFAYHSVQGDRGLIAWVQLSQQVEIAQATLEKVSLERSALEHRTRLLRPDNLDPDMLDERARQILNMVGPDELVIMEKKGSAYEPKPDPTIPERRAEAKPAESGAHVIFSTLIPSAFAAAQ